MLADLYMQAMTEVLLYKVMAVMLYSHNTSLSLTHALQRLYNLRKRTQTLAQVRFILSRLVAFAPTMRCK